MCLFSLPHRKPNDIDCRWQRVRGFASQYDSRKDVPSNRQCSEGSGGKWPQHRHCDHRLAFFSYAALTPAIILESVKNVLTPHVFSVIFLVPRRFGQTSWSYCYQCHGHFGPVAVATICRHCWWLHHYLQCWFWCVSEFKRACFLFILTDFVLIA